MDIRDLSIGNVFKKNLRWLNKSLGVISEIDNSRMGAVMVHLNHNDYPFSLSDLKPVLLTECIFKAIGFDYFVESRTIVSNTWVYGTDPQFRVFTATLPNEEGVKQSVITYAGIIHVEYLHELQNLYRMVTKKDLEFSLEELEKALK